MESDFEPELEEPSIVQQHLHALDPISLALGLIFGITGAAFLFGDVNAVDVNAGWIFVSVFGALGLILIAFGLRRRAR